VTEVDEANPTVEGRAHLMGNCDGNGRLAETARANDRNEFLRDQLCLDRGDRVFRPTMRVKRAGSHDLAGTSISELSEGDVIGTMKL
jgi:hypothetical protein